VSGQASDKTSKDRVETWAVWTGIAFVGFGAGWWANTSYRDTPNVVAAGLAALIGAVMGMVAFLGALLVFIVLGSVGIGGIMLGRWVRRLVRHSN
jgi:hypothetical protein